MSKEKAPFWAEGTMSKEDMGEVITLIMSYEEVTLEHLSEIIGLSLTVVTSAINGKGNHVYNVFNKTCEHYGFKVMMKIQK